MEKEFYNLTEILKNPQGIKLSPLTFVIGDNATGKSRFLEALANSDDAYILVPPCPDFKDMPRITSDAWHGVRHKIEPLVRNYSELSKGEWQLFKMLSGIETLKSDEILILEHPTVFMHPTLEAEMGSILVEQVKKHKKQFLIETHSDFLIERVRLELIEKKYSLAPKDVLLLYFQQKQTEIHIYPIYFDEDGNTLNVPNGYREFFLQEESRYFKWSKDNV